MVFGYASGDDKKVVEQMQKLVDTGIDCFAYDLTTPGYTDRERLGKVVCRMQPGDTLIVTRAHVLDDIPSLSADFIAHLVEKCRVNVIVLSLGKMDSTPTGLITLEDLMNRAKDAMRDMEAERDMEWDKF